MLDLSRLVGPEVISGHGALAGRLRAFVEAIGLGAPLRLAGVRRADLPVLAECAAGDPCLATNPRCPAPGEIERLYELAL